MMIYREEEEEEGEIVMKPRILSSERSRPLHNFNLSSLKWASKPHMCVLPIRGEFETSDSRGSGLKSDSDDKESEVDKTRQSIYYFGDFRDFRRIDYRRIEKEKEVDDEIRGGKKLVIRLPVAAVAAFEKEKEEEASMAVPQTEKPWNLRTRRSACKAPNSKFEDRRRNLSPQFQEKEKKERRKFSALLTPDEIRRDFLLMTGGKLPRKPKKRPRILQKKVESLLPAFWLPEVTADRYKVRDQ